MYGSSRLWGTLFGGLIGIGVAVLIEVYYAPATSIQPKVIVSTPEFALESKTELNIPGLEGCTLFTLTNENMAWPLRVVKCSDSISVQSNNNNTVYTR